MRKLIIIILIIGLCIGEYDFCFSKNVCSNENSLLDELQNASVIMWFGAHPDDELYTAGTFGYFTRDLHGHLVIVSLYYNPEYVDNNIASSEFLGNADYIGIE